MAEISIIIPTLNREGYKKVRRNFQSVFQSYEIVVVDKSPTLWILQYLEKVNKAKKLKVLNQKRIEAANLRKLRLHESKGEVIAFIDDAIPDVDWDQEIVRIFRKQDVYKCGKCGMASCSIQRYTSRGKRMSY